MRTLSFLVSVVLTGCGADSAKRVTDSGSDTGVDSDTNADSDTGTGSGCRMMTMEGDGDADGTADSRSTYTYDADGNLLTEDIRRRRQHGDKGVGLRRRWRAGPA